MFSFRLGNMHAYIVLHEYFTLHYRHGAQQFPTNLDLARPN